MAMLVRLVASVLFVAGFGLVSLKVSAQVGPSNLGTFNVPVGQFASVGLTDTFTASSGILAPASLTDPYNFVDVYTFTTSPSAAFIDTISFNIGNAISNMQIAVFSSPAGYTTPGTYINQIGSTTGSVTGGGWANDTTTTSGLNTIVSLSSVALTPGGTFTLEIRGNAPVLSGAQTASYSGNLLLTGISAVPEPQSAALMLMGLAGVIASAVVARRHRA
jgi:hypothetical protein